MNVKQALESGYILSVECRDGEIVVRQERQFVWKTWRVGQTVDIRTIGANVVFYTTPDSVMGSFLLFHDLPGAIEGTSGGSHCRHYATVTPETGGVIKYGTRGYSPAHGQSSKLKKMTVKELMALTVGGELV